jgi:hypothetical protein
MPVFLLLGAALLLVGLLGLRWFVGAAPADLAYAVRTFLAVFGAIAATGLVFVHRYAMAGAAVVALVLAIRSLRARSRGADPMADAGPDTGGATATRTALLEMRLDHASGEITGRVRAGRYAGRMLADLGLPDLLALLADARRDDPPSAALLEAYLDRREPDWRAAGAAGEAHDAAGSAAMDEPTALAVLGLAAGATAAEIKAAHRRLMAGLHPDHGGSTYLASQINRARDILLRRPG